MVNIKKIATGVGRFTQEVLLKAAYIPTTDFDTKRRLKNMSPSEMQSDIEHNNWHAASLIAKLSESDLSVEDYVSEEFDQDPEIMDIIKQKYIRIHVWDAMDDNMALLNKHEKDPFKESAHLRKLLLQSSSKKIIRYAADIDGVSARKRAVIRDNQKIQKDFFDRMNNDDFDVLCEKLVKHGLFFGFCMAARDRDGNYTLPSNLNERINVWIDSERGQELWIPYEERYIAEGQMIVLNDEMENTDPEKENNQRSKTNTPDEQFFHEFEIIIREFLSPDVQPDVHYADLEKRLKDFYDRNDFVSPYASLNNHLGALPENEVDEFMDKSYNKIAAGCLQGTTHNRHHAVDIINFVLVHDMDTQKRMSRHMGMPVNLIVQGSKQSSQQVIHLLNGDDFTKIRETIVEVGFDSLVHDILTRDNILPKSFLRQIAPSIFPSQNYSVADKQAFFNNVDMYPLRWAFAARDEISTQTDNPVVNQINIVAHDGSHKTRLSRVWKYINGLDSEGMRRFQFLTSLAGANRRGTQDKVKRGAASTADPYKFAEEQWFSALNHDETFTGLLKSAVDNEFIAELYFMLNADDSYAPEGAAEAIRGFCDGYGGVGYLDKILEDYELPNVENIEELVFKKIQENDKPSNDNDDIPDDLDFTPIDGLHVTAGGAEEPLAVDVKRKPKSEPSEREPVNHIPLIKEKLRNHLDIDGEIEVFGSMLAAKKIAKGEADYELKILQLKTTDGQLHQIATNNWLGSGTQIIKPPVEIDVTQAKLIDITELRENGSAWPIRHKTEDSYLEDIAHHCRTPKDELTPYLPKFYGWSNDRQIVEKSIDTCAEFIRTTGKKIASNDRKPFECGALKAVTTPNRMFSSLDTMGFDDREELYAYVFAEHPELETHVGKPAVSAKNAFNEAADIIAKTEMVPQLLLADDYEVCDRPLAEISEFFSLSEKGCVTDWKPLMRDPMQKKIPANWDQFMIASGIAVRKDGALEPNWDHPELIKRRDEPKQRVA